MNIREKTISGVAWNMVARTGQQLSQFIMTIFLARILMPEDFGTMAMVLVVINFARLFAEQGFAGALIQKKVLHERHIFSIFWLNLITGALLAVILFAVAPVVARFYDTAALALLTKVLAFDFFIASFAVVPKALLQKRLAFKKIAKIEITAIVLSGVIAVSFALTGFGVWSLVFQSLSLSLISSTLTWGMAKWKPKLLFDFDAVKELLLFSLNLMGFNLANFGARNADSLLIGRFFGSLALGIYNRAYSLMLLPISQINNVLGRVMFPALATVQDDHAKIKRVYLEMIGLISLIASPLMLGLMVSAEFFIQTLYGEKWLDVVPLLRILCLVGLLQAITNPVGWIYMATGRTDWMFRMGLAGGVVLVAGIGVGVRFGTLSAVAIYYAMANMLLFYPSLMVPGKLIGLKFMEIMRSVAGPFASAVCMAVLLLGLRDFLRPELPGWQMLVTLVVCGMFSYIFTLHFMKVRAYIMVRELLGERLKWRTGIDRVVKVSPGL